MLVEPLTKVVDDENDNYDDDYDHGLTIIWGWIWWLNNDNNDGVLYRFKGLDYTQHYTSCGRVWWRLQEPFFLLPGQTLFHLMEREWAWASGPKGRIWTTKWPQVWEIISKLSCLRDVLIVMMFQFSTVAGEQRWRIATQKIILGLNPKDLRLFIALFK